MRDLKSLLSLNIWPVFLKRATIQSTFTPLMDHSMKSHCYCKDHVAFYSVPSHSNFPRANSSGVFDNAYLNISLTFLKRTTIQSTVFTRIAHSIKSHCYYTDEAYCPVSSHSNFPRANSSRVPNYAWPSVLKKTTI